MRAAARREAPRRSAARNVEEDRVAARRLAALCAASAASLWAATAASQAPLPAVTGLCFGETGQERAAAEVCGILDQQLREAPTLKAVEVDRVMVAGADFDPSDAVKGARELIDEGAEIFKAGRGSRSLRQLRRGLEAALMLEPWILDRSILADALLWNLRAEVTSGATQDQATALALRLLNFTPSMRVTWPSAVEEEPVRAIIERAQRRLDTQRPGRLEVQCPVAHSEVFLNGRFVGVTPLLLGNLPAGEHLIRVRKTGYEPVVHIVESVPSSLVTLDVVLSPTKNIKIYDGLRDKVAVDLGASAAGAGLVDLRALLVVDQAIVVRVTAKGDGLKLEGFLYDMRSSQLLLSATARIEDRSGEARNSAVGGLLQSLLALPVVTSNVGEPAGPSGPGVEPGGGLLDAWWFWAGMGVVTAGALTTGIVLFVDEEPVPTGRGGLLLRF